MNIEIRRPNALYQQDVILTITSRRDILITQAVRFGQGEESKSIKIQVSNLKYSNGGVVSINLYDTWPDNS